MLAYTYIEQGKFELREKPIPEIQDSWDAIVRVTLGSICSSDLHIKHGSVPRAVPGITVGHEMVGVVEKVGADVTAVKPGDRVTVNVETFCGECFFCRRGYVNNCTGDLRGGYGFHYWRWSYGDLYFVVRVVEEATTYYCLREVSGKGPVRSPALSGSLGDRSRKL